MCTSWLAEASLFVFERSMDERLDVVYGKRLELEDAAATDEGAVDGEEGVFRGRADEDDDTVFHFRQQHILLGLVETMDLVDEEEGPPRFGGEERVGLVEDFAEVLDATGYSADLSEDAAALFGEQAGECGFAGSGWTVEDDRAKAVCFEQPAEQFPGCEEMLLSDEFVQACGSHSGCQGEGFAAVSVFGGLEERWGLLFFGHGGEGLSGFRGGRAASQLEVPLGEGRPTVIFAALDFRTVPSKCAKVWSGVQGVRYVVPCG